ncbi:uncharacterized protein B0H18DRAFT_1122625 [Fomitopsis serialis]|uniref:uncharacterized protein n=1 Tax=Fomitopsis serialis TaxID=139415 RepID=UPI002007D361|nr:uncharacterized protein B0H18DRAFT_1122625 [Neoantrodia serialis]KAH9919262.1 hypothetical protein B0H18DRAFT_1122625 [Neoantrodia serialis]
MPQTPQAQPYLNNPSPRNVPRHFHIRVPPAPKTGQGKQKASASTSKGTRRRQSRTILVSSGQPATSRAPTAPDVVETRGRPEVVRSSVFANSNYSSARASPDGKDRKQASIIENAGAARMIAARVLCVFNDQDAQAAAPAGSGFNFAGQQQPSANGVPGQQRHPSMPNRVHAVEDDKAFGQSLSFMSNPVTWVMSNGEYQLPHWAASFGIIDLLLMNSGLGFYEAPIAQDR